MILKYDYYRSTPSKTSKDKRTNQGETNRTSQSF